MTNYADAIDQFYNGLDGRTRYYIESTLGSLPVVGTFVQARDRMAYMDDYMSNRGLSWDSIKYPTMTVGYKGVSGMTSFVSSNISKLYR